MHKKRGSREGWSNYPCTYRGKTLMAFPSMWTLRPDFWRGGAGDKGSAGTLPTLHSNFICLTLLYVMQKKLEKHLFICANRQHFGKPANESGHSELLRNLDQINGREGTRRKRWKPQLLLKHDQSIRVCLRGTRAHLSPTSVYSLSSLP